MQKIYITIIAFSILALVSVCSAANWQTVTTFTGESSQTTDYFTVPTQEWRISWSYINTSQYGGAFGFYVYRKGGELCDAVSCSEASGTTYMHEKAGEYYLETGSVFTKYTLTIEYDSSAIPEYSTIAVIVAFALVSISVIAVRKKLRKRWFNTFSFLEN
jgi:Flp pilus assembly pilin Flp